MNFWKWLQPEIGRPKYKEIPCSEIRQAARELQIRELCFWVCVNMVANAIGRCEVRTFRDGEEVQEREYYTWNIAPNKNQNSTAFMHKLVAQLYLNNEALIVDPADLSTRRAGRPPAGNSGNLLVADGFGVDEDDPTRENRYSGIIINGAEYKRELPESRVLRLKLNHKHMRPVISAMCESFEKLAAAAEDGYRWERGNHLKVHVDQIAQGEEGWEESFTKILGAQIAPYLENPRAILPEFDGYEYTEMGGEKKGDTRDIKAIVEDIFDFTARGFMLPVVLVNGKVEATEDARARFLTNCVDPICDQLQEEINRKRHGYDGWKRGDFVRVDSSAITHYGIFDNAASVEKLVGSGAYTVNSVLRAANQPAINEPWADQHFMTRNLATIDEVLKNISAATAQKGGKVEQ